eukprot:g4480.t1.1.5e174189 g4480  g4480.t1 contig15:1110086-1110844(-)
MGIKDFLRNNNSASLALVDLISHEDWKLVEFECKTYPRDCAKWTLLEGFFDGEYDSTVLPLHQACALRPPREIVKLLISCYPEGLRMREETFHRLPLHIACLTNAPLEAIEALIHVYPEATRCKDSIGRLPIHYACAHDVPFGVIDLLLRTFPASAGCGDNNGWLPLHVASRRGLPIYIIQQLLDCFPHLSIWSQRREALH